MSEQNNWERRWHPLLQEWTILAATTSNRPWSGDRVKTPEEELPEYDPKCYLCPGVTRASGEKNPDYKKPFAFTNDFASFSYDAPDVHKDEIFEKSAPVHGTCRVICFTPKHNLTLAEMSTEEIQDVFSIWKDEYRTLGSHPKVDNVLIFENKGKVVGVSNPHPHGQIYATGFIPRIVKRQLDSQAAYKKSHGTSLLEDLARHEIQKKSGIVAQNEHIVAFVPYFARFAYEIYIVPRKHIARITDLTDEQTEALVDIFHQVVVKYDNLFNMSFPNMTMLQNAPTTNNPENEAFHFHIEFYPPLRDPDKLKYLAGFESGGGNIINPIKPGVAAGMLREAPVVHYKKK